MINNETDNIELRSEKIRHVINKIPSRLVRTGTLIITLVIIALAVVFYTIRYPITINAQGEIFSKDSLRIYVPYKYLFLFNEPRLVSVSYEGQNESERPLVYPICCYNSKLFKIGDSNFFFAAAYIGGDSSTVQIGQKAEVRIIVSNKTLWQQVFK